MAWRLLLGSLCCENTLLSLPLAPHAHEIGPGRRVWDQASGLALAAPDASLIRPPRNPDSGRRGIRRHKLVHLPISRTLLAIYDSPYERITVGGYFMYRGSEVVRCGKGRPKTEKCGNVRSFVNYRSSRLSSISSRGEFPLMLIMFGPIIGALLRLNQSTSL